MRMPRAVAALCLVAGTLTPAVARAEADKEHKLLMAEIRMLQEEQQQLRQVLAGLNDTLKAINARLDQDASRTQKAFADQKLIVEGVAETSRVLREKADETNVRLSSMTQELQSLRQTVASMPTPSTIAPVQPGEPGATDPGAAPVTPPAAGGANPPPPNVSPTQLWDRVYALYTAGQFDLAIEGFQSYIRGFPTSPLADDAQLYIGHSFYSAGKYADAASALMKVITGYPQSDSVPPAYYKLGLTYEAMKQFEAARRAFETVIKNHNGTAEAQLARQALVRVQDKKEDPEP
ncbi:MAG TPA: tetratricopeptide repeat protein [Vicinamibacterales bacterium]|nr:tetratricopeptide repeat protein [Vicinamibacterales bacterium]